MAGEGVVEGLGGGAVQGGGQVEVVEGGAGGGFGREVGLRREGRTVEMGMGLQGTAALLLATGLRRGAACGHVLAAAAAGGGGRLGGRVGEEGVAVGEEGLG